MNRLKKYNSFIILVIILLPIFCIYSYAYVTAPGGEVSNAEDFVTAFGGDEAVYADGNTIIFRSDVSVETPITIKSGEYTLQGSGCYIWSLSPIILDGDDVVLTLGNDRGSDDHPSLTFSGLGTYNMSDNHGIEVNNGTLNIYTGTLIHEFANSPFHMTNGTINMIGGVIRDNTAENGGAFYIENGELNIIQGLITECNAVNGGAIFSENGKITLISPEMSYTKAETDGGILYMAGGEVLINNGLYQYSEAQLGGAICNTGGILNIAGGAYVYNKAVLGGVIYNWGEMLMLNPATVLTFNEATEGAAVYNNGKFVLQDAQITYNKASSSAGGVLNGGQFIMNGGSISMNESAKFAGGIVNLDGIFEMYDGSVSSNKAAEYAQGIYHSGNMILGEHCFISFNNDVYVTNGATVEVVSDLTANTPVATLTLENGYVKGTQIVTGHESMAEKIAITGDGKGTWSLDTEGKLQFERTPLSLPYQIVIVISAAAVIIIVVIISVRTKKKR